ncbi:MAG: DHHW family protein [Muribaculaceae bacterium]|nr:DHHW family protein [Alistipes senegalensis]MCM1474275.1 DHHW family protein [Muribaculaceae bacterium]
MSENSKNSEKKRNTFVTNVFALLNIIIIILVIFAGFVYLLFFKRDTVSHEENRNLTEFPEFTVKSYISGEYTEGIANYYDDTVPNRSFFKTLIANRIMPLKGLKYGSSGDDDGGVELYNTEKNNQKEETPAEPVTENTQTTTGTSGTGTETTTTTAETLPKANVAAANGEVSNNILVVNKRAIMLYGGAWGNEVLYAEDVNAYKKALGKDVNVYSMVLPTSVSYYLPENYTDLVESEKTDLDSIEKNLKNVTNVDAYTALLRHKKEAIYSRTDHHWQPLGAYYAAEEFAKQAGVDFADISEYEKHVLSGYVGTMYGYTQSATLLNNPEPFIYYEPKTDVEVTQYSTSFTDPVETTLLLNPENFDNSSYYLVFGTDDNIRHVKTKCRNGRNLVIFKDSYGNALLPFLTGSFENIYICDIRYFDRNAKSFINEVGATDVLFAMCTYSAVGVNREHISTNLNQ